MRGSVTLVSTGTIIKRSHGLTTIDAPFDNDGTLELLAGILDVSGEGLDNAGTLRLAAGTRVTTASFRQPASGTLELTVSADRTGVGSSALSVATGPLVLAGTLILTADLAVPADERWQVTLLSGPVERAGQFSPALAPDTLPGATVRYDEAGVLLDNQP